MNVPAKIELGDELVEAIAQRVLDLLDVRDRQSDLLTVKEAAVYLRCKEKRIHDLCSQRRLAYEKEGSRVLIRRIDLDFHLERRRRRDPDENWD